MPFRESVEHFVTLFDSNYLPMGLCLHQSLLRHAAPFHLWVVCMDELVEAQLKILGLPCLTLMSLDEVETAELLRVKPSRSRGEYCWTLTPFTPEFVFKRDTSVQRVTYLDADLFFFDSPQILLSEFEKSGKDVLITPHAYASEYDQSNTSGIFCVQFMTFLRTDGGLKVLQWWQDRCIEWCYARMEDGKFGDQKYLDSWPQQFSDQVHVLKQVEKTLAPWNVRKFLKADPKLNPVLYHFHSLKIVSPKKIHLFGGYRIGSAGWIYKRYVKTMTKVFRDLQKKSIPIPFCIPAKQNFHWLRVLKRWLFRTSTYYRM